MNKQINHYSEFQTLIFSSAILEWWRSSFWIDRAAWDRSFHLFFSANPESAGESVSRRRWSSPRRNCWADSKTWTLGRPWCVVSWLRPYWSPFRISTPRIWPPQRRVRRSNGPDASPGSEQCNREYTPPSTHSTRISRTPRQHRPPKKFAGPSPRVISSSPFLKSC